MPTAEELDNQIWFTHTTHLLPLNGLMIPGSSSVSGTRDPRLPIAPDRFTLHWFPQSLVEPHFNWKKTDTNRFVIVESAKQLKATLYGGYAEDFMSVGYHELSADSVIFAPKIDFTTVFDDLYPRYKGRLIGYSDFKELSQLLDDFMTQVAPNFKLSIPHNQKKQELTHLTTLMQQLEAFDLSTISETDAELHYIRNVIKTACQQNPRPKWVTLESDVPFHDVKMEFNGQLIKASDFFKAWQKPGFFVGLHHGTPFRRLEIHISRCIQTSIGSLSVNPITEKTIDEIRSIVGEIKHILTTRLFPSHVLSYFEQKIEIDLLEHWLPILVTLSQTNASICAKFARLNDVISQSTVLSKIQIQHKPVYEAESIPKQPTAGLLSQYTGTIFSAYKRQRGDLVDAIASIPKSTHIAVQHSLKRAGIVFYLAEDELIVPDINTPMVGSAAQRAQLLT